ncbi:MAG: hypothetical protein WDO68_03735 [Gammaproteobacteria bacterium]
MTDDRKDPPMHRVTATDDLRLSIVESAPLRIEPPTGELRTESFALQIQVFQFRGLLCATEYNAEQARLENGLNAQTVNGMNTLLMAYAALEALILETTLISNHELYFARDSKGRDGAFRRKGLLPKYVDFLESAGRAGETVPGIISEVSDHRIALTHSEPHNERTRKLGAVISATEAARIASELRKVAEWLWQGKRPAPVAAGFDEQNIFLR